MPENLICLCPKCGSGDVHWCGISVRPHCVECHYWAPVNMGDAANAVAAWNAMVWKAYPWEVVFASVPAAPTAPREPWSVR